MCGIGWQVRKNQGTLYKVPAYFKRKGSGYMGGRLLEFLFTPVAEGPQYSRRWDSYEL